MCLCAGAWVLCACGGQSKSSGDSYSPFALLDIGFVWCPFSAAYTRVAGPQGSEDLPAPPNSISS